MGSCLAVAHRVFDGTLFLGTAVALQRIGADVELVKTCDDNCMEVNPGFKSGYRVNFPRHGGEADGGADSGGAVLRGQDITRGSDRRGRPAVLRKGLRNQHLQILSHRFFLTGVITPVSESL
jgi:hypothetical protein